MSEPHAKVLVIDTNLLLHFKRPNELDWTSVGDDVVLVVLPVVLRELEKIKVSSPVPRLRERAAKVVTWLGSLIDTGVEVPLRRGLQLRFHFVEPALDFTAHSLSREVQDDHLIAGLIELSQGTNERATLVTADIGLKLKAKQRGFTVVTRADGDRLAEEPDVRERELAELRSENQRLKARLPLLAVRAADGNARIQLARPQAPPQRQSLETIMRSYPELSAPSNGEGGLGSIAQLLANPSERARAEYNYALQTYYREYRDFLAAYTAWASGALCRAQLPLVLQNNGTAPASDIDVILTFPEDVVAMRLDDVPTPPKPPVPPERPEPGAFASLTQIPRFPLMPATETFHARAAGKPLDWNLKATQNVAHFKLNKLKHGFSYKIERLVLQFPDIEAMRSITVNVEASAAEGLSPLTSQLHVVLA